MRLARNFRATHKQHVRKLNDIGTEDTKVKHSDESTAIDEAKRLARHAPDVRFYVLKAKVCVQKRDLDVVQLHEEDMPF